MRPFAEPADLAARLPGGLPPGDVVRAAAALTDASALVRAAAGRTWVDATTGDLVADLPDIVVTVTINAARRSFVNPDMLQGETVAGYGAQFAAASPDVYLTREERRLVRGAGGRGGVSTMATTRGDLPDVRGYGWSDIPEEYDPYTMAWPR